MQLLKLEKDLLNFWQTTIITFELQGLFWVMPVDKAVVQIYKAIINKMKIVCITKRWCFIALVLKRIPKIIYNKM